MRIIESKRRVEFDVSDLKPTIHTSILKGNKSFRDITFMMFKVKKRERARYWINTKSFYVIFKHAKIVNLIIYNKP